MKAALFKAVGQPMAIEEISDPEPGQGEVVLKVARCGVCGTDLHATSGHGRVLQPGAQIGHEFSGEVIALGKEVERLRIGDRVAGIPVVGCGQCEYCRTGIDILCRQFVSYGKAMAEFVRLPERGAVLLPSTVSLADGALIEPLAVGRRGVRLAAPQLDARALLIGPGPIGLGVLFWLHRLGVRNVAVLASSERRRGLAEAMGVQHFIVEGEGAADEVRAALGGPPDIVFEAAGVPGVIARGIDLVRPQGMIMALGYCTSPESIVPAAALMKDVTIRFSVTYTRDDYEACAQALEEDGDRARGMVTDVVGLDAFPLAFEQFRNAQVGGGKLLCNPWA